MTQPAHTPPTFDAQAAFTALEAKVSQALGSVAQALQRLQPAAPAATPPAPTTPAPAGDSLQTLLDNPDAWGMQIVTKALQSPQAREAMNSWYRDTLGPLESIRLHEQTNDALAHHRQAFDAEFGAGKFDQRILPGLEAQLRGLGDGAALVRSSRTHLGQIIQSLKGQQFNELVADRAAAEAARATPEQPPYLLGNGRPIPPKGGLTPQEQALSAAAQHKAGVDLANPRDLALRDALGAGLGQSNSLEGGIDIESISAYLAPPAAPGAPAR